MYTIDSRDWAIPLDLGPIFLPNSKESFRRYIWRKGYSPRGPRRCRTSEIRDENLRIKSFNKDLISWNVEAVQCSLSLFLLRILFSPFGCDNGSLLSTALGNILSFGWQGRPLTPLTQRQAHQHLLSWVPSFCKSVFTLTPESRSLCTFTSDRPMQRWCSL